MDETIENTSLLNNLGVLYSQMHRYEEAEGILQRVVTHREYIIGKEHRYIHTLT